MSHSMVIVRGMLARDTCQTQSMAVSMELNRSMEYTVTGLGVDSHRGGVGILTRLGVEYYVIHSC